MWPFNKKQTVANPTNLAFSPEQFFENHCRYGHTEIRATYGLVAIVEAGADESITEDNRSRDGILQTVTLRVASSDGGFQVMAQPMSDGPLLRERDCVLWVPMRHDEELSTLTGDSRSGWIGLIVAKIAPEIDGTTSSSPILHSYVEGTSTP